MISTRRYTFFSYSLARLEIQDKTKTQAVDENVDRKTLGCGRQTLTISFWFIISNDNNTNKKEKRGEREIRKSNK